MVQSFLRRTVRIVLIPDVDQESEECAGILGFPLYSPREVTFPNRNIPVLRREYR